MSPQTTYRSQNAEKAKFRARVIEPADSKAPNGVGVGVGIELEFNEDIPGLTGDTVLLSMRSDADMLMAEQLRNLLNDLLAKVTVSNP